MKRAMVDEPAIFRPIALQPQKIREKYTCGKRVKISSLNIFLNVNFLFQFSLIAFDSAMINVSRFFPLFGYACKSRADVERVAPVTTMYIRISASIAFRFIRNECTSQCLKSFW